MSALAHPYVMVGGRLWLDFANSSDARREQGHDALRTFGALLRWMEASGVVDEERAYTMRRRAEQQPTGAEAILQEARRLRQTLHALAAHGARADAVHEPALLEINRVLGRSSGVRRLERSSDGGYSHGFVPAGDAFATLLVPLVESAAESLAHRELERIRRCAAHDCERVFIDETRNSGRRWCEMEGCGNRAKARRYRGRRTESRSPTSDPREDSWPHRSTP